MRRIILLVVVAVVLVGSGILTVQWGNGSATIKFNKETAKERTKQLISKARAIESEIEADDEGNTEEANRSEQSGPFRILPRASR